MATSPQWVVVGRIRDSYGVHGALKVEPYSPAFDSVLRHIKRWRLVEASPASGASVKAPVRVSARPIALPQDVRCQRCRVQGDMLVAELQMPDGLAALTREQVLALKGVEIAVDRADFPPADEDEFYHTDLIGCEVIGQADQRLGVVVAVDDHGAQQVIRLDDGLLIPFVEAIVQSVDLDMKRIRVDWAADWR
ncbi:MAG: ribosome maturation factor RimM [Lautropia sp.]|nr:ribosome maturation factor RimM [Lautropia sp.]